MGFLMKMQNVDAMYDQYLDYADPNAGSLAEALASVRNAVETFHRMDSFQGQAATALKGYLMDMHTVFTHEIQTLCELIQAEYAVKYMQRYAEAPIAESGEAVLPEDELEQKRSLLAQAKDRRIPHIDEELSAVVRLLPPGTWPAIPTTAQLHEAFASAHDDIERLKNGVQRVEEEGERLFQDGGPIAQHLARIKQAIQETALDVVAVTGYEEGSYFASDTALELSTFGKQAEAEVAVLREALISAQDQMLERQILREEEAFRLMEEGRSQWELVGIGASVIGTLAAAAAVFGTGGAAVIVSGASAMKSLSGTIGRIQDYASGKNVSGNLETDYSAPSFKSVATSTAASAATSAVSKFAKGKSGTAILTGTAKSAVSVTGKASQAVTTLADVNHASMREEAQGRLRRIEELKARRSPQAA